MLRITRIENSSTSVCLKIEGRLTGDWVELLENELEKALREALRDEGSLSLDLAAVDFASPQAAELLKAAKTRGVRVSACSPYLYNLLSTRTA